VLVARGETSEESSSILAGLDARVIGQGSIRIGMRRNGPFHGGWPRAFSRHTGDSSISFAWSDINNIGG